MFSLGYRTSYVCLPTTILGSPNRLVYDRVMNMLYLMRLVYLELAVLGSLDRHDTKETNKMTLRRT